MKFAKWILPLALLTVSHAVFAEETATKTYSLTHLQKIAASNTKCAATFKDLQTLAKKPITLAFTTNGDKATFKVTHADEAVVNHSYKIVQQNTTESSISRVGIGTMDLNNQTLAYVLQITADLKQKDFKFNYPMIITNEKNNCIYTAILVPDSKTIATFKKHIEKGNLDNGADLTSS